MAKTYTPARTNKTDKGSFKNDGQKSGKQGAIKAVKEVEKEKHTDLAIKHLINDMYSQKKSRKVPARKGVIGMGRE